jgi:hypothetical protein
VHFSRTPIDTPEGIDPVEVADPHRLLAAGHSIRPGHHVALNDMPFLDEDALPLLVPHAAPKAG